MLIYNSKRDNKFRNRAQFNDENTSFAIGFGQNRGLLITNGAYTLKTILLLGKFISVSCDLSPPIIFNELIDSQMFIQVFKIKLMSRYITRFTLANTVFYCSGKIAAIRILYRVNNQNTKFFALLALWF